jgi:hypothetical protein
VSEPDPQAATAALAAGLTEQLSAMATAMRAEGSRVGVGELLTAHRALAAIDPSSRRDTRSALRAVLCSRRDDLERFERAFLDVFGGELPESHRHSLDALGEIERAALPRAGLPAGGAPADADPDPTAVPAAWSDVELLRHKDFAHYSDAEMVLARELISRLAARSEAALAQDPADSQARPRARSATGAARLDANRR